MTDLLSRAERLAARHPTVPLALRAAIAAVGAWLVVWPMSGVADDYPYYAPLGAVVTVSTTVATSIRTALQTFLALVAGATLGIGGAVMPTPTPVAIAVVVGVGTLVAAWRHFGGMGVWVPVSALFIMIIGRGDPWPFALAYLLLTPLGALVGAVINAAMPPLHLAGIRQAQEQLRSAVVDQLGELADGLSCDTPPTYDDWAARRLEMAPDAQRVQELVATATQEPPVNWRAHRWRDAGERLAAQGRALVGLALFVGDLTEFLAHRERADLQEVPLGPGLRPPAARALVALAEALRTVDGSTARDEELREARQEVRELASAIRDLRARTGRDLYAAGALVVGIERTLLSISPAEDTQSIRGGRPRST